MINFDPEFLERCKNSVRKPFVFGGTILAAEAVGIAVAHIGALWTAMGALDNGLEELEFTEKERKCAQKAGMTTGVVTTASVIGGAVQAASPGGGVAVGNLLTSVGSALSLGTLGGAGAAIAGVASVMIVGPVLAVGSGCAAVVTLRALRKPKSSTKLRNQAIDG